MIIDASQGYIIEQFVGNGEERSFFLAEMMTYENDIMVTVGSDPAFRAPAPFFLQHSYTLQYIPGRGLCRDQMSVRFSRPPRRGTIIEMMYKTNADMTQIVYGHSALRPRPRVVWPVPSQEIAGVRGVQNFEAGYVYAPYIPIYTTPIVRAEQFGVRAMYGSQESRETAMSDIVFSPDQAADVIRRFRETFPGMEEWEEQLRQGPSLDESGNIVRVPTQQDQIERLHHRIAEAVGIPPQYMNTEHDQAVSPRPVSFQDIRRDLEAYIRRRTSVQEAVSADVLTSISRMLSTGPGERVILDSFGENPADQNVAIMEVVDVPRPTIEDIRELGAPEYHFTAPEDMEAIHIHNTDGLVLNTVRVSVGGEWIDHERIMVEIVNQDRRGSTYARVCLPCLIRKGQEVSVFCKRDQLRHNAEIDLTPKKHVRRLNIPGVNDGSKNS